MATLSSPSLILVLFHLLRLTAAAPVDDICRKTNEPPRCVSILKASSTRTPAAPLPELEQIAIDAATDSSGLNKIKVHNLFLSEKKPNLKRIYGNCENLYMSSLDALLIAPQYLQRRQYAKLVAAAGVVRRSVGGCAAAIEKNASLRRANEDAGVLADAIAIIAKNLSFLSFD
ncbi:hypothetical protein ACS0TY_035503 [Phlomoides rotata]